MRDREIHTLYKMHIVKEKNAHSYTFIPGNGISDLLLPLLCWKLLVNAIMKYLLAIWQTNGSVENYGEALRKYKACVKISSDMDKWNMVYTYKRVLCSHEKEKFWHLIPHGWNWQHHAEWNKSDTKGQMHASTNMKYLEQANSLRHWVDERLAGTGGRGTGELLLDGYRVSAWDDEKVLVKESGDGCMTLWI